MAYNIISSIYDSMGQNATSKGNTLKLQIDV